LLLGIQLSGRTLAWQAQALGSISSTSKRQKKKKKKNEDCLQTEFEDQGHL
jgi:hypothetical protein